MNIPSENPTLTRLEVPTTSIRRSDYLGMKPLLDALNGNVKDTVNYMMIARRFVGRAERFSGRVRSPS